LLLIFLSENPRINSIGLLLFTKIVAKPTQRNHTKDRWAQFELNSMKRNYILLLLITIVTFTSCDKEWSEINELDINGKVKKLTTFYYKIENDSIGNTYNDTIKIDIYILNRKGQLVDRNTKVFSNNKFRYSILTKFKYNFKGQLIKEIYNMPKDFENIGDFEDFETFFTYKDSLQISSKTNYTLEELLFHINEAVSYD